MDTVKELPKQIKMGEAGYINKNCWLARNLNYPPAKRCQYCESKFPNCLFFRYLIITLIIILFIVITSFLIRESISRLVVVSIFSLVIVYGYFFNKSTEKIITANFAQRKAKEELEELTQNLQQKVSEQTKDIQEAYDKERIVKEKINSLRVEDEAILSSIGDGVVAIDNKGEVMFMNKSAEEMFGLKSKEAANKKYDEVLTIKNAKEEIASKEDNPFYRALNFGKKITTHSTGAIDTFYCARKDGSKFSAAITAAPIILNGKITGVVGVFRDVTVERQVDKSKSEFVSLASHQLRTPLSAIKWYSEALLDGKPGKLLPKQKKYLKEVYSGNERMIKLIDILLNASRIEAGNVKSDPKEIDAKEMMCNIVEEQKFDIKKKKQKIVFVCNDVLPGVSPKIFGDPNLVRMVFQNIISNAVKYTPANGKVTCSIDKKDGNIVFEIKDTGIGIPKDQQKRVFEKLFRANNAFSHDPEGNGLGLYVAKTTVDNLGGKIWFESEEGVGTTFFVSLPSNK